MAKKRKSSKDPVPTSEKVEAEVPLGRYNFLKAKAEELSTEEEVVTVEILAYLLLNKAILEYQVLTPEKTVEDILKELEHLNYLHEKTIKNPYEDSKVRIESIIHYVLNNENLSTEGQFKELKRGLRGYFSDKKLILEVIDYIKKMNKLCYIEDSGSLILFEDYVKKLPDK